MCIRDRHIGEDVEGVDAGVTIPAQLTVNVFKDTQADGVKGAYEENFEGISVTLIHIENGEDAESVTYKTDEEGNVTFAGVSPGEYAIAYQLPGQWRATRQVSAASGQITSNVPQTTLSAGRSEPFTLTMGQTGVKMYIGAMLSGSISGVVYYDDDADAKLGANETYCRGEMCIRDRCRRRPRRAKRRRLSCCMKAMERAVSRSVCKGLMQTETRRCSHFPARRSGCTAVSYTHLKLVQMAVKLGKQTRPDIKLGICGEHGGDPSSVMFCHKVGLNYVSCSPFRVPIARLAAAHAAILEKQGQL